MYKNVICKLLATENTSFMFYDVLIKNIFKKNNPFPLVVV